MQKVRKQTPLAEVKERVKDPDASARLEALDREHHSRSSFRLHVEDGIPVEHVGPLLEMSRDALTAGGYNFPLWRLVDRYRDVDGDIDVLKRLAEIVENSPTPEMFDADAGAPHARNLAIVGIDVNLRRAIDVFKTTSDFGEVERELSETLNLRSGALDEQLAEIEKDAMERAADERAADSRRRTGLSED